MFGREHNQTGILIEPSASHAIDVDNLEQVIDLRNKLWYVIATSGVLPIRLTLN